MRSRSGARRLYSSVVAEQQGEVGDGDRLGHAARLAACQQDPPLVDRQVEGGLELLSEFMNFVHEHHVFIFRREQEGVEVGRRLDGLAQDLVDVAGEFCGDDLGDLGLA